MINKLLSVALLLGSLTLSTIAMENPQGDVNNNELMQVVEEDYQANFLAQRTRAINAIEVLPAPNLSEQRGFFATLENTGGWAAAIANYKAIMVHPVIPAETEWANQPYNLVRGFAKKYNERIIVLVDQHIAQQKQQLLNEFMGM